uniref:Uncharacterized protein n=1 Tax=Oryza sativa subsp. japonica TaxID=39947 RepID=Q5VMG0_ORYSJ|nr:hypothetical protein [Oryza sativa Japonica Group]
MEDGQRGAAVSGRGLAPENGAAAQGVDGAERGRKAMILGFQGKGYRYILVFRKAL